MYPRLSNRASVSQIEKEFGLPFLQPLKYTPTPVIDGSGQTMIPLITDAATNILFGLWGITPEEPYRTKRTRPLLSLSHAHDDPAFGSLIKDNRCLIIVSGFYSYFVREEVLHPYYVHLPDHTPFSLAGVYKECNEGRLCCSFLMTPAKGDMNELTNEEKMMPLVIPGSKRKTWLGKKTRPSGIETLMNAVDAPNFKYYPLPKSLMA